MMLDSVVDMSKKNMHLIILALYAYVLFQVDEDDYVSMVLLTVAACLSICYLKKPSPVLEGNKNKPKLVRRKKNRRVKEGFENPPQVVRQLSSSMGPYDGLCLQTGGEQYWMKKPDETALIPNDALFTYMSSQGPTKPVFTDNSGLTGPPVDGHPDSAKKMFMFANNRTSPNCCPSTFSTSTGCVCTTKNQRDFVAGRGVVSKASKEPVNLEEQV